MRTDIFTAFADLPEEFSNDFNLLWELSSETRHALIPYIPQMHKAETLDEKKKIIEEITVQIKEDFPKLSRVMRLLSFLYKQWDPIEDTPESFLNDLEELSLIPADKAESGKEFLLNFLNVICEDNRRRLRKSYATSLIPNYIGYLGVVDFRSVIENPYKLSQKIEEYTPKCVDFTPVAIIRIRRDSGDSQTFEFQCEEDDVRHLISKLQATLKQLEQSKIFYKK